MRSNTIINGLFAFFASFVAAVEIAYFRLACMQSYEGATDPNGLAGNLFSLGTLLIIVVLTAAFTLLALLAMRKGDGFFEFCFKYRYAIAVILLAILVAFQVSGTSIGMLTNMLGGAASDYFGVPRNIRRDEWVVNTPLALSQAYSGYTPVSSIANGGGLDLTLVYAQACWDISTLFRPFLWGYLLLPSAYGLSFFWCARFIALFMVSFEMGRFLTNDKRRLALIYAVLITLSPLVQWWFAVNSIAEILLFSQLFILFFRGFLQTDAWHKMALFSLGMIYCLCAYVLSIYPAWQVAIGYVMLALCLLLLIRYFREHPGKRSIAIHAAVFIVVLVIAVCIAAGIVLRSMDVISAVSNSEYPGRRLETGGKLFDSLFDYSLMLVGVIDPSPIVQNVCERAGMFTLFPLGFILGLIVAFREKDGCIIAMLVFEGILLFFGLVGLPEPIAKITLLSNVTDHRLAFGTGVFDIMLLVRSIALFGERPISINMSPVFVNVMIALVAVAFGVLAVFVSYPNTMPTMRTIEKAFSIFFIALCVFAVLSACFEKDEQHHKMLCIAGVVALAGFMVNPVQLGLSGYEGTPLANAIEQVKESDDNPEEELWVADTSILAQACISYGAPTLNSVALYARPEIWAPVDPDGTYYEVYNRYAHTTIKPTYDNLLFKLTFADAVTVYLDNASLKTLGVRYWVSEYDLTQYSDETLRFEFAKSAGPYNVYKLVY